MAPSDEANARAILELMLSAEFPAAELYRDQLKVATLSRHDTGCAIHVDRSSATAAPFDPRFPNAKLPVEGFGHGKIWLLLHGREGYLDDLELIDGGRFPYPGTVRVRTS